MLNLKLNTVFLSLVLGAIGWEQYAYKKAVQDLHVKDYMSDDDVLNLLNHVLDSYPDLKAQWDISSSEERIKFVHSLIESYNYYCHRNI